MLKTEINYFFYGFGNDWILPTFGQPIFVTLLKTEIACSNSGNQSKWLMSMNANTLLDLTLLTVLLDIHRIDL
ncbi:uncharacterized protein ASCRUDRAFT_76586, partial [Ascoidea rubescens DSM 1968]